MPKDDRASAARRGYGPKWKAAREEFLREHPWCRMCAEHGKRVPATRVDHVIPHRGDMRLFWRRSNWQPLCEPHHNGPKQSQDRTGRLRGCDVDGLPLDCGHHWRREG